MQSSIQLIILGFLAVKGLTAPSGMADSTVDNLKRGEVDLGHEDIDRISSIINREAQTSSLSKRANTAITCEDGPNGFDMSVCDRRFGSLRAWHCYPVGWGSSTSGTCGENQLCVDAITQNGEPGSSGQFTFPGANTAYCMDLEWFVGLATSPPNGHYTKSRTYTGPSGQNHSVEAFTLTPDSISTSSNGPTGLLMDAITITAQSSQVDPKSGSAWKNLTSISCISCWSLQLASIPDGTSNILVEMDQYINAPGVLVLESY